DAEAGPIDERTVASLKEQGLRSVPDDAGHAGVGPFGGQPTVFPIGDAVGDPRIPRAGLARERALVGDAHARFERMVVAGVDDVELVGPVHPVDRRGREPVDRDQQERDRARQQEQSPHLELYAREPHKRALEGASGNRRLYFRPGAQWPRSWSETKFVTAP